MYPIDLTIAFSTTKHLNNSTNFGLQHLQAPKQKKNLLYITNFLVKVTILSTY